jgi:DNA polymerase-4
MSLRFLFVDFNSYFASVEQQLHPELRNKPIAVVPMLADTTSCIAASYEAKRFGIRTGTKVRDAKKVCPGLILVPAKTPAYIEYHHKLIEAVESCVPVYRVLSIDEMACELTGSQQEKKNAVALAERIKDKIAKSVGSELRSSIGIAPNLFLSKTASDMQKPNGLVVIEKDDLPDCLFKLDLSDLTGIGRKMKPRLEQHGIHTVKDLCVADKQSLRKAWGGIEGERMHAKLRGETLYDPPSHRSTIGHSHVLPPSMRNEEKALAVLHRLLQKAGMRLRKYGYRTQGMSVSVKYLGDKSWREAVAFSPTQDTMMLTQALTILWGKHPPRMPPPLAIGVTLFHLSQEDVHTLSLFDKDRKIDAFNLALDKLNAKYGKNTVYFAGAHAALDSAPTRIAFTHIPDYV